MEPYTEFEIAHMRAAFNAIEAVYALMDDNYFEIETQKHRRLNKKIVDELAKEEPDHEIIYFLLNAINTAQNGEQQTTPTISSEEEPKNKKTNGFKRWIKKSNQKRE